MIILIVLALISVNMVLLLISGWILAYAGIFFLGFGGSRWTSDIAINYYRTVLGVAVSLLAMVLLVGIGKTFLDDYYLQDVCRDEFKELGVMLVASMVLLTLVNKIPPMLAGIVGGGGGGIGNIGGGAAIGTAAAATGMAAGMMMASATHAAGGASAIKAAFDAAHDTMSSGGGMSTGRARRITIRCGGGGGGAWARRWERARVLLQTWDRILPRGAWRSQRRAQATVLAKLPAEKSPRPFAPAWNSRNSPETGLPIPPIQR